MGDAGREGARLRWPGPDRRGGWPPLRPNALALSARLQAATTGLVAIIPQSPSCRRPCLCGHCRAMAGARLHRLRSTQQQPWRQPSANSSSSATKRQSECQSLGAQRPGSCPGGCGGLGRIPAGAKQGLVWQRRRWHSSARSRWAGEQPGQGRQQAVHADLMVAALRARRSSCQPGC